MRKRCYVKSTISYPRYGGRGIKMCSEWIDKKTGFESFYKWAIRNGYKKGLSIERKDVNRNYCPENCKWATPKIQANNRSNTVHITYCNETHTPSEWSDILDMPRAVILDRYKKNWPVEKILDNSKWKNEGR